MWFSLEPCDAEWGRSAPFTFRNEVVLDAPPEEVFEILVGTSWPEWFPDILEVRWTSDPPPGPGSTRHVILRTQQVVERFLVYEPGKRWTFYVEKTTLPLTRRFLEDYRLEPTPTGGTRLDWRVHYRPRALLRPLHPVLGPIFGKMFRDGANNLVAYVTGRRRAAGEARPAVTGS